LRIENGGLLELVDAFIEATKGYMMPAGSVVVLSSASYLAWVSTTMYIEEYTDARRRVLGCFNGGVEVVHGFPVLVSGCYDTACIRGIRDVTHWLASVHVDTGRDIAHTRSKFLEKLHAATGPAGSPSASAKNTAGSPSASAKVGTGFSPDPICYNLISDLTNKKKQMLFYQQFKALPKIH
jgi:hypothetical protein